MNIVFPLTEQDKKILEELFQLFSTNEQVQLNDQQYQKFINILKEMEEQHAILHPKYFECKYVLFPTSPNAVSQFYEWVKTKEKEAVASARKSIKIPIITGAISTIISVFISTIMNVFIQEMP